MALTGCSGFPNANLEVFKLDDKPSKYKENGLNIHSQVRVSIYLPVTNF